jgi:heme a synthase
MDLLSPRPANRQVANWILLGVFMLVIQVILGGVTRLTGSGLSITEWNVVTGTLPPLNQQQWITEFEKYKQTPQFHLLNPDFALSDFKFIFFWEWFHRFWARMVGFVFIAGFIYLLATKKLKREMIEPLLILFLLGAMQGIIGWIMVKSGLTGDAIYVRPAKLALHFIFALGLICYALWFGLRLLVPSTEIMRDTPTRGWTWGIILVLCVQLLFAALMAGNKAATAAPTWPTINGEWIPLSLFRESPLFFNFIDNKITVQFIHRGLAYLLFFLVGIWSFKASRLSPPSRYFKKIRFLPLLLVSLQILLGIVTILQSPGIIPNHWGAFEWVAELHQITGLFFLLMMIYILYLLRPEKP